MRLTLEGGTNTECGGLTSMKECFSAKSVPILQFNILALRGEFHPHTSSSNKKIMDFFKLDFCSSISHNFINIGQNDMFYTKKCNYFS